MEQKRGYGDDYPQLQSSEHKGRVVMRTVKGKDGRMMMVKKGKEQSRQKPMLNDSDQSQTLSSVRRKQRRSSAHRVAQSGMRNCSTHQSSVRTIGSLMLLFLSHSLFRCHKFKPDDPRPFTFCN